MKTERSSVVHDSVVTLDDTRFIECEFNSCEVRYSGGPYAFEHTTFNNPNWVFTGPALRTIELLKQLGKLQGDPSDWAVVPQIPLFDSGDSPD